MSWSTPSDNGYSITNYKVEQSLTGAFSGEQTVLTSTHQTTTYEDSGLTASTDYYYRISAENTLGFGTVSDTVSQKTFGVPDAIDDLTLTVISTTQINLSWTQPALNGYPLDEYEIFRSENNSNWQSVITQSGTTLADQNLNVNDLYYYKVTVANTYGTSDDSNVENDITLPTPTSAVTLTVISDEEIQLTWNQPVGDQQTGYLSLIHI